MTFTAEEFRVWVAKVCGADRENYWFEIPDPNEDRGDLRDEGRNPDGSGESYGERNA